MTRHRGIERVIRSVECGRDDWSVCRTEGHRTLTVQMADPDDPRRRASLDETERMQLSPDGDAEPGSLFVPRVRRR